MAVSIATRNQHTCLSCGDRFTRWQTRGVGMYIGYYCKTCKTERDN